MASSQAPGVARPAPWRAGVFQMLTPEEIEALEANVPAQRNEALTGCYFGTNCVFTH